MFAHDRRLISIKTLAVVVGVIFTIPNLGHAQEVVARYSAEETSTVQSHDRGDVQPDMEGWEHRLAPRIGMEFHFGMHRLGVPKVLYDGRREQENNIQGSFTGLQLGWSLVWRHTPPVEGFGGMIKPANSMRLGLGLMGRGGWSGSANWDPSEDDEGDEIYILHAQLGIHAVVGYQFTLVRSQSQDHLRTFILGVDWMPVLFRVLAYEQGGFGDAFSFFQTHQDLGRMNLTQFRLFAGPVTFDMGRSSNYDLRLELTVSPWRMLGARSRSISLGLTLTKK